MLARRLFALLCSAALALFCPGCAGAPDRWTVTARTNRQPHTSRWETNEVDVQISGPIPTFRHD